MEELRVIMKKKIQKSVNDHVSLNLLLIEQLISNLLFSEEGSMDDPASSAIRNDFLPEQRVLLHRFAKKKKEFTKPGLLKSFIQEKTWQPLILLSFVWSCEISFH